MQSFFCFCSTNLIQLVTFTYVGFIIVAFIVEYKGSNGRRYFFSDEVCFEIFCRTEALHHTDTDARDSMGKRKVIILSRTNKALISQRLHQDIFLVWKS